MGIRYSFVGLVGQFSHSSRLFKCGVCCVYKLITTLARQVGCCFSCCSVVVAGVSKCTANYMRQQRGEGARESPGADWEFGWLVIR